MGHSRRWILALVMFLGGLPAVSAIAAEAEHAAPWQTLPATPALPHAASTGYVDVGGARLFHATFGRGRPVVMLHGGLGNSNYWGNVIPYLVRAGFQVTVIDSRGHGRSSRTAESYSYGLMARDVIAVLDALHLKRVDLVGWSDGGIIGLDIAMHHPERLHRLFTYGANSDPSGLYEGTTENPTFAAYIARTASEYKALSPTPEQYDKFLEQIQVMWEHEPNYSQADLASIRVPAAIADGAHDEGVKREHTEYIAKAIPGARLVILEDLSHFGMLQDPREFSGAVINFLRGR